jgi:hypothetical protein
MSARLTLRRLRAALARDGGVTLTELVVAMTLATLVSALTLRIFVSIDDTSGATVDRTISSSSARNTIEAWTGYLRVADGTPAGTRTNRIEWLTNNDMLFYADLYNRSLDSVATTGAPTMIWLRLDGAKNLVEEQFSGTAAAGSAPQVCRVLVQNVTTPALPLFSAIDDAGAAIPPQGTAPVAAPGCQPLPVTVPSQTRHPDPIVQGNLSKVSCVSIDFVVRDTRDGHPIEFTSQAVLPAQGGV